MIGQPHIALGELAKNAYDADAFTCEIRFGEDFIEVADDGHGMSFQDFSTFWMRVGTTHKVDERRSARLGRPLTGSKGVGRLAAQFLAEEMSIETTSASDDNGTLIATVDWSAAIRGQDLTSVEVPWKRGEPSKPYPNGSSTGTRLRLSRLRNDWGADELGRLGAELWMLRSPFRQRNARPSTKDRDDFDVEIDAPGIAGAKAAFDKSLVRLFENWRARITGKIDGGRRGARATITVEFRATRPGEKPTTYSEEVGVPVRERELGERCLIDRTSFEILVFDLHGRQGGGLSVYDMREYLAEFGNVALYDAGFRLPYYGSGRDQSGQDWLGIAADQGRRLNISELLPERLRIPYRYMLDLPAPGRIFGAVNIDTGHERSVAERVGANFGEWLEIQPGRDRLLDNRALHQLRDLVRFALDYYANRYKLREAQRVEQLSDKEPATAKQERALSVLEQNREAIPTAVYQDVRREVSAALDASRKHDEALDRRAALLAPLASAGMAALSLNHEMSREVRVLARAVSTLRRVAMEIGHPELNEIADEFEVVSGRIGALQELFAPLLTDMDEAAVTRLRAKPIVRQTVAAMTSLMPGVAFDTSDIPDDLLLPVGGNAEWNALLQNLLANAWNAMLGSADRRVKISGGRTGRGEWLKVSDTGVGLGVSPEEASKYFEPFERGLSIDEQRRSIALGGQGLGLAIVRMIARRRGAEVKFVPSEDGFSTTFELSWRG